MIDDSAKTDSAEYLVSVKGAGDFKVNAHNKNNAIFKAYKKWLFQHRTLGSNDGFNKFRASIEEVSRS